jgi:hypothetical protein
MTWHLAYSQQPAILLELLLQCLTTSVYVYLSGHKISSSDARTWCIVILKRQGRRFIDYLCNLSQNYGTLHNVLEAKWRTLCMPLRHIFQDIIINHPLSYLSTRKGFWLTRPCWKNGVGFGGLVTWRAATLQAHPRNPSADRRVRPDRLVSLPN